jgi:hypothetical protein
VALQCGGVSSEHRLSSEASRSKPKRSGGGDEDPLSVALQCGGVSSEHRLSSEASRSKPKRSGGGDED